MSSNSQGAETNKFSQVMFNKVAGELEITSAPVGQCSIEPAGDENNMPCSCNLAIAINPHLWSIATVWILSQETLF